MSDKDYPAAVRAYCQAIPERMHARTGEWRGLLNRHHPGHARSREGHGLAVRYVDRGVSERACYVLTGADALPIINAAVVAVRDGEKVEACYVAGWRNAEGSGIDAYNEPVPHAGIDPFVILHPIPAFDGWQRSAGRAFHVEVC